MEKPTRRLPIVERDEWLLPAEQELNRRYERYTDKINAIEQAAGSIVDYANGYRYFGWQRDELLDGWWLREWLPGAHDVYVFGDFNNWQRTEIRMQRDAHGVWSAFFPEAMYRDRLRHGSLYKLHVHGDNGWKDRIPAYATRVVQDEATKNYTAQFWAPEPFDWQGDAFDASKNGSLLIYEAHVGMAQEKEGVGTYREFTEKILPIIKKDGYNAVQIALTPAKEKHSTKATQGHFAKAGKGLFRHLREIRLAGAPEQELGQELTVEIFAAGDTVKVTGTSMGKGYQGRMRRWNFAGSKDTHGCEKVHRNNGSIGNNTFPGHVFKGRKMAGHWGNETVTEMGLTIVDVRPEDNVILVKGSVPGPKNGLVLIRKQ